MDFKIKYVLVWCLVWIVSLVLIAHHYIFIAAIVAGAFVGHLISKIETP